MAVINNQLLGTRVMIAIQANEHGHPILVESFEETSDGLTRTQFREVDAERWREMLNEEVDGDETPRAIIPVTSGLSSDAAYDMAYFEGLRAGWNFGVNEDVEKFEAAKRARRPFKTSS